jgi:hypothetical protein
MYPPQNNGPHTTLTDAINEAVTSITVADGSILPTAPNVLTIGLGEDAELVLMESKTENILAVTRGYNSTTAKAWVSGDWIYRAITAQDVSALQENVGEKLQQYSTMPEAGAGYADKIVQFVGATDVYKSGLIYKCELDGESYVWSEVVTPAAIGAMASDAAPNAHAHGSITNAGKIGTTADLPVFTLSGGTLGTKSKADARIALDLDPRGFEYGGREIPFTWAQIKAKIADGDFTGLRVGDYKDITLNGTFYDAAAEANKTITNNVFRMEIAGIDSYYRYADTNVPHHIDFISRDCLAGNLLYNATDTNSGAYIGSALFTTLNGANGLQSLLPSDVAAVILNKRGMTEVKTSASASSWAWNDMGKLWLPTEQEVWGHVTWAEHGYGGGLSVHYPIFQDGLRHIVKGDGNGGSRCSWWCASSVAGSAACFCIVYFSGYPNSASATYAHVRVPLCFRVA